MDRLSFALKQFSTETFSSLRVRNYRLYYIGQIISTSGTFMQSIAQAWLVLNLTGSGAALGVTTALQYLPVLFLGPYGGVIADRYSKRKILYLTQAAAGILALTLGLLVAFNLVRLWMVLVLAFGLGIVNSFDNPTRQTFLMEMVGKDQLRNAVTLYSSLVNLSRVIGPAIAGGLIAAIGLAPCFIINGISYAAVVIMLWAMNPSQLQTPMPVPGSKGQMKAGFLYAWNTPVVRNTLLMMALIGTLTFEFQVSLPLIAQFTFKGTAASYAFLSAAMGVGAVLGGLMIAGQKRVTPSHLVSGAFLFGAAVVLASFMPSLALTGFIMVLVGFTSINFTSLGNSVLQLESSPQMRGRVMSFWAIAFLGSTTLGGPLVGWFAQTAGPRWGLALGGFAALAAGLLGFFTLRKTTTIFQPVELPSTKAGEHPHSG